MALTGLDCHNAYVLRESFLDGAICVSPVSPVPAPYELTRGEWAPPEPIAFHQDEGHVLHDFVGTTEAVINIVSSRVIRVLERGRFTGWRTFNVTLHLSRGLVRDDYFGLAVTGRAGPIQPHLSQPVTLPPIDPWGMSITGRLGLCFERESWDGTDIFVPEGTALTYVVESVARELRNAALTNLDLQRASEIEAPA